MRQASLVVNSPVQVGQIIAGKYELEEIIGHGGVGVVLKAKHLQLLEPCAIKFMLPAGLDAPTVRARFLREARACARLRSDNVVRIFDVGELDIKTPYMVLEYLQGVDLHDYLGPGRPLPVGEASVYVLQICAALGEAHGLGIVHRDLKPANVFLERRSDGTTRVKLLDFGISKVLQERAVADPSQTMDGTIMGTPSFMAPEQARGGPVDARTDIWSVGVMLYLLITGHLPFEDANSFETLAHVLTTAPVPPSVYVPTIPKSIEAIILQCLEKSPALRPPSVGVIAEALCPFADEVPGPSTFWRSKLASTGSSAPTMTGVRTVRQIWRRRRPLGLAALGVVVSVVVALAALLVVRSPRGHGATPLPGAIRDEMPVAAAQQVEQPADRSPEPPPAEPAALPSVSVSPSTPPPRLAASSDSPPSRPAVFSKTLGFNLGSRH